MPDLRTPLSKMTRRQLDVLRTVENGGYLTIHDLTECSWLERKGFIEQVNTSYISMVSLCITDAGRAALNKQKGSDA